MRELSLSTDFAEWFLTLELTEQRYIMICAAIYSHYVHLHPEISDDCSARMEALYRVLNDKNPDVVKKTLHTVCNSMINILKDQNFHVEWDPESNDYCVVSDYIDEVCNELARGSGSA